MKTFRRPFWKACTTFIVVVVIIIGIVLGSVVYFATDNIWGTFMFLLVCCLFLSVCFTQYFYVMLTNEKIIIRNSIYIFWKKEICYKDIMKLDMKWAGGVSQPYIQIRDKRTGRLSWQYVIDLVNPKEYDELIDMLRVKGVTVETKGIANFE